MTCSSKSVTDGVPLDSYTAWCACVCASVCLCPVLLTKKYLSLLMPLSHRNIVCAWGKKKKEVYTIMMRGGQGGVGPAQYSLVSIWLALLGGHPHQGFRLPHSCRHYCKRRPGLMKERPQFKKKKRKKLPFNQRSDGPLSAHGHRAHSFYIILLALPLFPV